MSFRYPAAAGLSIIVATGLVGCGASEQSDDSGESDPVAAISEQLDELAEEGTVVGAEASVYIDGEVHQITVGAGDLDTDADYPDDAHVRIASVTKAFTSAMVLQLVEEGKLELDEAIETYLPGSLEGQGIDARNITVRHLLRHQSGLPEMAGEPDATTTYTPTELLDLALEEPAQFEPGAEMKYTNTNYVVAGMLVEELTGQSYRDALTERITEPNGLSGTYLPETGDTGLAEPHPRGYQITDGGDHTDVTELEPSGPWASGGIVSTGEELIGFFRALNDGDVVANEQLKQMRDTVPMDSVPEVGYGLGVMNFPVSCDTEVWGQAGDVPGFQTIVAASAEGDRAVSFTTNQGAGEDFGPEQMLGIVDQAVC